MATLPPPFVGPTMSQPEAYATAATVHPADHRSRRSCRAPVILLVVALLAYVLAWSTARPEGLNVTVLVAILLAVFAGGVIVGRLAHGGWPTFGCVVMLSLSSGTLWMLPHVTIKNVLRPTLWEALMTWWFGVVAPADLDATTPKLVGEIFVVAFWGAVVLTAVAYSGVLCGRVTGKAPTMDDADAAP